MFCPGKLALVFITCLFVNNCDDNKVYWRGLTSVVGWAKLGRANAPERIRGRICFFMNNFLVDYLPGESAN
jgi:hypothetical protein